MECAVCSAAEALVLMHLFRLSFEENVLQTFLFGALP
jgi:hypothetical protein